MLSPCKRKHRGVIAAVALLNVILTLSYFVLVQRPDALKRYWNGTSGHGDSGHLVDALQVAKNATLGRDAWLASNDAYIGTIVAAARADTDMGWIDQVRNQRYVFNVDEPYQGEGSLTVVRNKGQEAMVYLSYIIDNYDALPPYVTFIHGHLESWHQHADIYTIIRNVRLDAVDSQGYVSLRCDWSPSCPVELRLLHHDAVIWGYGTFTKEVEDALSGGVWQMLFPDASMPETLAGQCCAQFIVTSKAIKRHARDDYVRLRKWLLTTDFIDDISGRIFEKL